MVRSALASAHTKHIQLRHINQDKQEKKAEAFANDYCGYELKGKIPLFGGSDGFRGGAPTWSVERKGKSSMEP
jgi:hypothetical protein